MCKSKRAKLIMRGALLVTAALLCVCLSGCGNTRVNLYIRDNGAFKSDYIAEISLDDEYLAEKGVDAKALKDYICAAGQYCGFTPSVNGGVITFSRAADYYRAAEPGTEDARLFVLRKAAEAPVRYSYFIVDYVEEKYENPLKDVNSLISRFAALDNALKKGFSVTAGDKSLPYAPFAEAYPALASDADSLNLINRAFYLLYSTNIKQANSTVKGWESFEFYYGWEMQNGGDYITIKHYRVNTVAAYVVITVIAVGFIALVILLRRRKLQKLNNKPD